MNKTKILRKMFKDVGLIRVVGAHDGLTAKLVEKNGFDAVWASGLEVSTSYAVPDANILTMTQHLERVIEMNDATKIPIIADCDTGFGNSNNVIHMVKRYEAAGIAAVCVEDKHFPKVNSFIPGRQELATIAEFVGKIMAAKNAQSSAEFMVIARIEALIAGWGQTEAFKRARAYIEAGADAILIHSKASDPKEIVDFVKVWENRAPLVIVPTTYFQITTDEIRGLGIKMVIYANHGIRAQVKAVNEILSDIKKYGSTCPIEGKIASMKDIFELQGMPRMKEEEAFYLRTERGCINAIIPAAGDHLEEYSMKSISNDIPIAMLDINGKTLLQRQYETFNRAGINNVCVVGGYKSDLINVNGVKCIDNQRYRETGILHSIMCASEQMQDKVIIAYGDLLFDEVVLARLLKSEEDITLLVGVVRDSKEYVSEREWDFVISDEEPLKVKRKLLDIPPRKVLKIGKKIGHAQAHFEFSGIVALSGEGAKIFREVYKDSKIQFTGKRFHDAIQFEKAGLSDLIQEIIDRKYEVHCVELDSGWLEINSMSDYKLACSIIR